MPYDCLRTLVLVDPIWIKNPHLLFLRVMCLTLFYRHKEGPVVPPIPELVSGKIYRKVMAIGVKARVSCSLSLKPIH